MRKFLTLITSALLCFSIINPTFVKAAETTEVTKEYASNREEARKKNEEMHQKWNALTDKQRADIYKSLRGTLDAQAKFLDKLVKYEIITQEDAQAIKDDMYQRFDDMKSNNILFPGKPPVKKERNGQSTEPNNSSTSDGNTTNQQ